MRLEFMRMDGKAYLRVSRPICLEDVRASVSAWEPSGLEAAEWFGEIPAVPNSLP
jgi:hypothetical protein